MIDIIIPAIMVLTLVFLVACFGGMLFFVLSKIFPSTHVDNERDDNEEGDI